MKKGTLILNIELHGHKLEEEIPRIAIYLLDVNGKVEKKLASAAEGRITLDRSLAKEKEKILGLGADVEDLTQVQSDALSKFGIADQFPVWEKTGTIEATRDKWSSWVLRKVCISGKVTKCISRSPSAAPKYIKYQSPGPMDQTACYPICDGRVEVYVQDCCLDPSVSIDMSALKDKLRYHVENEIISPPPPPPPPDGITIRSSKSKKALRRLKRFESFGNKPLMYEPPNLSQDLNALESLSYDDAIDYIVARPHLYDFIINYECTDSMKLGEVKLGPDGYFTFCHNKSSKEKCVRRYSFKVKQWHENQWVYIYGHPNFPWKYFMEDQFADLRTHLGLACYGDAPKVPHDKPAVMLQLIGHTESYKLISHWNGKADVTNIDLTQVSDDSIAVPIPEGGLVFPRPDGPDYIPPTDSVVPPDTMDTNKLYFNCPWAKTLKFFIYFDPEMQAPPVQAYYYRISIVPAGEDGKPLAGVESKPLMTPLSWNKKVGDQIEGESLGPEAVTFNNVNVPGLYKIPYGTKWLGHQYHGEWNTESPDIFNDNGRYLVAIEVFKNNGKRLVPATDGFYYLRWLEETGDDSGAKVNHAKLQHLIWIDNTHCYADIHDLRKNGIPSEEECQFFTGPASSLFSTGFYAYHSTQNSVPPAPPETFMWYYHLYHHRGLNGPDTTIESGALNKPPGLLPPPAESSQLTFGKMLDTDQVGAKCSFSVDLWVYAKHWDGIGRILEYDDHDQAAFAIEVEP